MKTQEKIDSRKCEYCANKREKYPIDKCVYCTRNENASTKISDYFQTYLQRYGY